MGCYTVPAVAAIVHFFMRKKMPELKNDRNHKNLNLLLLGGAIFGVVDHIWNRELFAFSMSDVLLGVVITASIITVWGIMAAVDKVRAKTTVRA